MRILVDEEPHLYWEGSWLGVFIKLVFWFRSVEVSYGVIRAVALECDWMSEEKQWRNRSVGAIS